MTKSEARTNIDNSQTMMLFLFGGIVIFLTVQGFINLPVVGPNYFYWIFMVAILPILLGFKSAIAGPTVGDEWIDCLMYTLFAFMSGGAFIILIKSLFFFGWETSETFRVIIMSLTNVFSILF